MAFKRSSSECYSRLRNCSNPGQITGLKRAGLVFIYAVTVSSIAGYPVMLAAAAPGNSEDGDGRW